MGEIEEIFIPPEWPNLAEEISQKGKIVLVIGGVDSGKTTFITFLANYFFKKNIKTAIVDSDIGQSDIGPPTTIGWGFVENCINKMRDVECRNFYFVGSVTPEEHELEMIIGVKKMCEEASENSEKVLIDTTGMIYGKSGKILKRSKIEILNPQIIICFQKEGEKEIEEIVKSYLKNKNMKIFFLKVPEKVQIKSREERKIRREENFKKYFSNYHILEIDYQDKVFLTTNSFQVSPYNPENFKNMLVCLISEEGVHLSLALIVEIDLLRKKILIKTPLENLKNVHSIKFSNFFLPLE